MSRGLRACLYAATAAGLLVSASTPHVSAALLRTPVAEGLMEPVLVTAPPGDSDRIFIIEKPGQIRIVEKDTLRTTPFLDIRDKVRVADGEQGLLGLAFHPDYAQNGYVYVNYTSEPDDRTVVSRFRVSAGDPNVADTAEHVILEIPQHQRNHNGGMIAFGPNDGYLYIGMGDGGGGNDTGNRGQNPDSLLGKMLRIDVDTVTGYAIPPDNPFVAPDTARHEIWAFGLRNPWRWSFDRANGDMYIADVGQNIREEVSFERHASSGGLNFGWRLKEGFECFIPSSNCDPGDDLTDPILQYVHNGRCSITGGYVYRGCAIPELVGHYLYGDFCTGEIWSFRYDGVGISDSTDRTAEIGLANFDLSGFGEDAAGELYICGFNTGIVWRIDSDTPADSCGGEDSCAVAQTGDVDTSGSIVSSDIIYLVNFVFKAGVEPLPIREAGDVDCNSNITSSDIIYLVNFVFKGGPAPCDVCTIL